MNSYERIYNLLLEEQRKPMTRRQKIGAVFLGGATLLGLGTVEKPRKVLGGGPTPINTRTKPRPFPKDLPRHGIDDVEKLKRMYQERRPSVETELSDDPVERERQEADRRIKKAMGRSQRTLRKVIRGGLPRSQSIG